MSIKVSVVTATFNSVTTINDCLDSVASQTWGNVDHVVIDGGSDDGTLDILQVRQEQLDVLVSEPDSGIYDALNKGISRASGDVLGFMHADDIYANPDVLESVANAFADSSVQAVFGDLIYVNKDDTSKQVRYWKSSNYSPRRLSWGWMPAHPSFYVRREWYNRIGGFDTTYKIAADYYSILQLFSNKDFHAVYLPEVFVKMRVGGASNRSLKNVILKSREDLDALKRTGVGALGGYGALAWKNFSKVGQFIGSKES